MLLLAVFSCRSNDSDNKVTAGGTANVSINLQGEAFDDTAILRTSFNARRFGEYIRSTKKGDSV